MPSELPQTGSTSRASCSSPSTSDSWCQEQWYIQHGRLARLFERERRRSASEPAVSQAGSDGALSSHPSPPTQTLPLTSEHIWQLGTTSTALSVGGRPGSSHRDDNQGSSSSSSSSDTDSLATDNSHSARAHQSLRAVFRRAQQQIHERFGHITDDETEDSDVEDLPRYERTGTPPPDYGGVERLQAHEERQRQSQLRRESEERQRHRAVRETPRTPWLQTYDTESERARAALSDDMPTTANVQDEREATRRDGRNPRSRCTVM